MTIENQPSAHPTDPVEADAKIIADAAIDLGQQRERELNDEAKRHDVSARLAALKEEERRLEAEMAGIDADEAEARAREEADKKAIAEADARLNHRDVPGPGPAPQPPRPRVG